MPKIVKFVGYGLMSKSVKLQVFLSPKKYMEMVNEARVYKINARTDSQLFNSIIDIFLEQLPILKLENERIKAAIVEKNATIMQLQQELHDFKLHTGELKDELYGQEQVKKVKK